MYCTFLLLYVLNFTVNILTDTGIHTLQSTLEMCILKISLLTFIAQAYIHRSDHSCKWTCVCVRSMMCARWERYCVIGKTWLMVRVGQNYIYTPYMIANKRQCTYGDFPAKDTIYTPYIPINVWFWPALLLVRAGTRGKAFVQWWMGLMNSGGYWEEGGALLEIHG